MPRFLMNFPPILLLLCLAYVFCYALASKKTSWGRWIPPQAVTWLLALLACGADLALMARSPQWRDATQIAWLGVRASGAGTPLEIGGRGEQALVGWPNGAFAPDLRLTISGAAANV